MIDWTKSMKQTFEYYTVDPGTWTDISKINTVTSCTINRDYEAETLGSATIDLAESLGECYFRVYLISSQNGETDKRPLGTFLVQTPSYSFDGKIKSISADAYTPLIELKENQPPIGYYIPEDENIMESAYELTLAHLRAPVTKPNCDAKVFSDFVADSNDTWISYIIDLIANAKYEFSLDELGRVLFSPKQDTASLQPVWTYDDSNSSILYPEISIDRDLYGIPNAVEVIYSSGTNYFYAKSVNNDPNSPLSTVSRGREIVKRVTNPSIVGDLREELIEEQIKKYADQALREYSTLEVTVTYTHGYCPVRLGDCVRLNYDKAGLTDIKAKVISQSIKCEPGTPVTEKAVFTAKFWG